MRELQTDKLENKKESKPYDNVNLRSEMAQEIISNKPDFIERWGLLIFSGILLVLLSATWFVKYPDTIETRAVLTAANAPKEIIPYHEGRLVRLFVHNNGQVKKGDIIGWVECTANQQEVINLSEQLDSSLNWLAIGRNFQLNKILKTHYINLGEIQQPYQQFITALQLYNDYAVNGFYAQKRGMLENDITGINETNQTLQNQKKLLVQDISLAKESYKMNETLVNEKVETQEEFRSQKSKFLNKQAALPQLDGSIIANRDQRRAKQSELEQLNHDFQQQKIIFQQALLSLKSLVDNWKKQYIIQSPVDGKVFFVIPLQENQYLQTGKLLGYINPNNNHFYAETNLPQTNFGKVNTGLKVQLRFDAYPYQEAGFVEGTLDYISKVPSDSGFLATIHLDHGLMTNNKLPIPYKNGLKAQAIIITKNMRLLERLYYTVIKSTSVDNK